MTSHIHPTALVSPHAMLDENVSVGPFTVIHDNAQVGSGTRSLLLKVCR